MLCVNELEGRLGPAAQLEGGGRLVKVVGGRTVAAHVAPRAFPDYPGGTGLERHLRAMLRRAMEDENFTVYEWEWWHFDYNDWRLYPILNLTFDKLAALKK